MNWTTLAAFALFIAWAAIGLAQLWFQLWSPDTFLKLMITDGVLIAIVIAWSLLLREKREAARLRDKSRLD